MKKISPVIRGVVEIVATFSLLATLVIVVMELSTNEKATRSATTSEVALSLSAWYSDIGLERVGGAVFRKGTVEPESISDEDLADFLYLLHGGMLLYQNAFILGQEGTLDSSLQVVTLGTLSALINQPGFQFYWAQRQSTFTRSFRDYVDNLESQNGSKTGGMYD
ncbi:MAG: hypothetical protein ACJAYE_000011 [Candidatus Azotimanducaceae bacterium]|jgi:hypothetical protein